MVLVVVGGPVVVLMQYFWQRSAMAPGAPPKSVAGWLALFAFVLCASFVALWALMLLTDGALLSTLLP